MALKYRISASKVPEPWRSAITPQRDSQGLYYTVDQLADTYGPLPLSREHLFAASYYKDSGSTAFANYQEFYDSTEYLQSTIPQLKYHNNDFLALKWTTPGFYAHIDYDHLGPNGSAPIVENFPTKTVNCSYWQPLPGEAYNEAPWWLCSPWGLAHYAFYRRYTSEPCYGENGNGIIYSFPNDEEDTKHTFYIWLANNQIHVRDFRPIQHDRSWGTNPFTYVGGSTYSYDSSYKFVFNVLLASGGGGGSGSRYGNNGDSGGSGAAALFRINLIGTNSLQPIIIELGGRGSSGKSAPHSTITFSPAQFVQEGYLVGGGRCNSQSDSERNCGTVKTDSYGISESDFTHIRLIKKLPGKPWNNSGKHWNNNVTSSTCKLGNQTLYFSGGSAGSDGGGAGSNFGNGGARYTGLVADGQSVLTIGAGAGGGCGGGSGGVGGMGWLVIMC